MLLIGTLLIFCIGLSASSPARRTEFGRKWDSSYTLRVDKKELSYDGRDSSSSTYIYKRDQNLGKYQEWSKKRGLISIEQKDANGDLWRVCSNIL